MAEPPPLFPVPEQRQQEQQQEQPQQPRRRGLPPSVPAPEMFGPQRFRSPSTPLPSPAMGFPPPAVIAALRRSAPGVSQPRTMPADEPSTNAPIRPPRPQITMEMEPRSPSTVRPSSATRRLQDTVNVFMRVLPALRQHGTSAAAFARRQRSVAVQSRLSLDQGYEAELQHYPLHKACSTFDLIEIRRILCSEEDEEKQEEVNLIDPNSSDNNEEIYDKLHQQMEGLYSDTPLHVACRYDAPAEIVHYLLHVERTLEAQASSRRKSCVLKSTNDGFLPLHLAVQYGSTDCVKALLEAEEEMIEGGLNNEDDNESGSEENNTSRMRVSALFQTTCRGNTPLHLAVQQREADLEIVQILLAAERARINIRNAVTAATTRDTSDVENAPECSERPANAVSVEAAIDAKLSLLYQSNAAGYLPIHLALRHPHCCGKVDLWSILLDADRKYAMNNDVPVSNLEGTASTGRASATHHTHLLQQHFTRRRSKVTLYTPKQGPNHQENSAPFDFFLNNPRYLTPEFIQTYLATEILASFLEGHHIPTFRSFEIHRFIANDAEMQIIMNEACSDRIPVMTFMADFYAIVLSLVAFYAATLRYLRGYNERKENDGSDTERFLSPGEVPEYLPWDISLMFVMAAYFMLREIFTLFSARKLYWKDFWNYINIGKITMILICARVLELQLAKNRVWSERRTRHLLLTTGVFLYLGAIAFLRATFLPFSLFVGGATEILKTLVPFLVSLGLALGCIAYGYWVGGFSAGDDSGLPDESSKYQEWVFSVFLVSLSGPSEYFEFQNEDDDGPYISRYLWTTIFAILVPILLLNVLIAVISSAWERITARQREVFWEFRLQFAAGVLPVKQFLASDPFSFPGRLASLIDGLDDIHLFDHVEWEAYPYSTIVKSVREADGRLYWDRSALVRDLQQKHPSESRNWDEEIGVYRSFEADFDFCGSWLGKAQIFFRFIIHSILWIACFFLGCITLGLWWPRSVRRFFFGSSGASNPFSASDKQNSQDDDMMENKQESQLADQMRSKMNGMKHQIDDLHTKLDKMAVVLALSQSQAELDWLDSQMSGGKKNRFTSF